MTITDTAPSATEAIAAPARLESYRDAMLASDAPLDAFLVYLRELAAAPLDVLAPDIADKDMARAIALGYVQGALQATCLHLTSRFGAEVRAAPPSGLAEVVRDADAKCRRDGCDVRVLPWTEACDGYCTDACEFEDDGRSIR